MLWPTGANSTWPKGAKQSGLSSSDKAVALHDFLIMPRDGCTELVEYPVGLPCRYTLTNRTTTLDAPEVRLDGYLAAELCLRTVQGDAPHDG